MECEICGKGEADYVVFVEGARLSVCQACSRGAKIISSPSRYHERGSQKGGASAAGSSSSMPGGSHAKSEPEFELVENFGSRMRNARNKMKLPLSVLAEKLAEKESFLDRIENQKTHPSEELARKIEKELGITILEESSSSLAQDDSSKPVGSKKGLTLGDILEIEQKKKKNK